MTPIINASKIILIVEDSDDDYEFTQTAFREANLSNPIHRCIDGESAIDYLFSGDHPQPGIILLDLNMPGTDGKQVLKLLKGDENLKRIPVIVLTTSSDDIDIDMCYENGANTYITKPVDIDGLFSAIKRLKEYWFEIAVLPKGGYHEH